MFKSKSKRVLFCGVFALLLVGFAFAQTKEIVFVDAEKVAENSSDVKEARAELEAEYNKKAELIQSLEEEIRSLRDNYEARRLTYSESAKKEAEENINRKMSEYKRIVEESQASLTKKQDELLEPILEKMKKISIEKGYFAVFDITTGKILYFDENHDVTMPMIEALNK